MTYPQAVQFLYDLRLLGMKPGLENVTRLAELAGHPQHQLRFLHVAGTNGKGSTCALLESVYRASGLKVGLFTSPHLVRFGERLQVNRALIPEADVVRLVSRIEPMLAEFRPDCRPTFFEAVTVMAFLYFQEQQCDLVVLETGLGGRLDATNIVTPLASLITNVQFDHQKWLGNSLPEIAFEKAGIIKPGIPVITTASSPEALPVIFEWANRHQSPVRMVPPEALQRPPLDAVELKLKGRHQKLNAALALETVDCLQPLLPVSPEQVRAGLASAEWPGRLQIEHCAGGTWVFDGAHNPAGAAALVEALGELFPRRKFTVLFGSLQDKDFKQTAATLGPMAHGFVLTTVDSERAAGAHLLETLFREACPGVPVVSFPTLDQALPSLERAERVLVTGSLHFLGQVMERVGVLPPSPLDERTLNDWKPVPARAI